MSFAFSRKSHDCSLVCDWLSQSSEVDTQETQETIVVMMKSERNTVTTMMAVLLSCWLLLILGGLAGLTNGARDVKPSNCSSKLTNFNLTSSSFRDVFHSPYQAHINSASAWCAKQNDVTSPWIQMSFGKNVRVTGMRILGSKIEFIWVKKFRIEYMAGNGRWTKYGQVLQGNTYKDYTSGKNNTLHPALSAHVIRVYPLEVKGIITGKQETFAPCLRMELYGCHVSCPDPGQPRYGKRTGNRFLDGMTVTFTCHRGHDLFGASSLRCTNGTWDKPNPSCKGRCKHPGVPTNALLLNLNLRHASIIQYRCKRGFQLEGHANLSCIHGRWDYRPPKCIVDDDEDGPVLCSDPGIPVHGGRHGNNFTEGQPVSFVCLKGFTLFGHSQITCINGSWSGMVPQCRAKCKDPGIPMNGGRHGNQFAEGQSVMFFCHQGYDLIGNDEPMCIAGQWSSVPPVCKPKGQTCTRPSSMLPNIRIYGSNKLFYKKGEFLFHVCQPGYVMLGTGVRTCLGNTWSKSLFTCVPRSCGDPGTPVNGFKVGLVYHLKSTVYYHCLPGHAMRGASVRECLTNGSWSGVKPRCTPVDCGSLPTPSNGAQDVTKTTYLGRVSFRCTRRGYHLIGSRWRVCQAHGNWSGTQPRCKKRLCDKINPPANGAMTIYGNFTYRSSVTFTCDKNHVMEGSVLSVCLDDGTWSSPAPRCKRICPRRWVHHNDACYLFKHKIRKQQSWTQLKIKCQKYKSKLLYLHDNMEWNFVKRHLKKSVSWYAIGLMYQGGGVWSWSDGSTVSEWRWDILSQTRGKKERCGIIRASNGLYSPVSCAKRLTAYICKKSA